MCFSVKYAFFSEQVFCLKKTSPSVNSKKTTKCTVQRRIKSPDKHLTWGLLRK